MIAIKGLRQGLLIVFSGPDGEPWLTRLRELETKLNANPGFFKGGTVAFDVKHVPLTDDDLQRALALLHKHEVQLWAVVSLDDATRARVRGLGLADNLSQPQTPAKTPQPQVDGNVAAPVVAPTTAPSPATASVPASERTERAERAEREEAETDAPPIDGTDGLLVRRRVRSGQVLRHPGHIVVIGDVNPGSQLLAGGDIIVWGRLQGSAHAGALGDTRSVICALEMSPSLVKIADATLALRPDARRKRNRQNKAETAQLKDQQIIFTPWEKSA